MTRVLLADVIHVTARHFDLTADDLTGPSRRRGDIIPARQAAMYLCRELTDHSLPAIGYRFNRDHTTVIHALRRITRRLADDPQLERDLNAIRFRLVPTPRPIPCSYREFVTGRTLQSSNQPEGGVITADR